MDRRLFLFLVLVCSYCFAEDRTYSVTANGTLSWDFTDLGPNPDITAAVGDTLTFQVSGLNAGSSFAIHFNDARYPTTPAALTMDGSLLLVIGMDTTGMVLWYLDENNMDMEGRICVLSEYCLASVCGGECTMCLTGYMLADNGTCVISSGGGPSDNCDQGKWFDGQTCRDCSTCSQGQWISAPCLSNSDIVCTPCTDCPQGQVNIRPCDGTTDSDSLCEDQGAGCPGTLPENCLNSTCSNGNTQCTQCRDGWWLNDQFVCTACSTCGAGQFISSRCQGNSDIICSLCTVCGPNQVPTPLCDGLGFSDIICGDDNNNGTNSTCPTPENCLHADCWSPGDIQCTECQRGFWIDNTDFRCKACSPCGDGEYVSWPCEGYTDTVCSPCYTDACGPCQVGWVMDLYGLCVAENCAIYGCGASNLDVRCDEYNSTHFLCTCPREQVAIVKNGDIFPGCDNGGTPPSTEEVLAKVNTTRLQASLVNGVIELVGVIVVDINGSSIELDLNSTVPIDNITDEIKRQIAFFLGGDYTADDINIEYVTKKRQADSTNNGRVRVTVSGNNSRAPTQGVHLVYLLLTLMTIALMF